MLPQGHTYDLTENLPSGDSTSGFSCALPGPPVGPSRTAHVQGIPSFDDPTQTIDLTNLQLSVDINCKIRDYTKPRVFIQKVTDVPGGPFEFRTSWSAGKNPGTPNAVSISDPHITTTVANAPAPVPAAELVMPGDGYVDIQEISLTNGFYPTGYECGIWPPDQQPFPGGTPISIPIGATLLDDVHLKLGDELHCVFGNHTLPTISVTKTVIPAATPSWSAQFSISPAPPDGQPQTKIATKGSPTVSWK